MKGVPFKLKVVYKRVRVKFISKLNSFTNFKYIFIISSVACTLDKSKVYSVSRTKNFTSPTLFTKENAHMEKTTCR